MSVVSPGKDITISANGIALVLASVNLANWILVKVSSHHSGLFNYEFKLLVLLVHLFVAIFIRVLVFHDLKLSQTELAMVIPAPRVDFSLRVQGQDMLPTCSNLHYTNLTTNCVCLSHTAFILS